MKLKDLLLEKPADYVDGNDKNQTFDRQRYDQFDGVGATEKKMLMSHITIKKR